MRRLLARLNRYDAAGLAGAALIVGGVYMVSLPAALVVAGVLLMALAVLGARRAGS